MNTDWQTNTLAYCENMSSNEPSYLTDIVSFTWKNTVNPRQLSGHLQGRLLAMFSSLIQPDCILEVGTFTGYSTLCLAEGLHKEGKLHSIEADSENHFKAGLLIAKSPFSEKIILHQGEALVVLPKLSIKPNLIFVDADKVNYENYFHLCFPMLKPGGLIIFDNTLWSGKVLESHLVEKDADTLNMHNFNLMLKNYPNIELVMLPIRDGLTVIRKN
jgi:caffeoyl-CoA O-methyltransferase